MNTREPSTPMQGPTKLKLAILTGQDSAVTSTIILTLARLAEARIAAILLDSEPASVKARLRNLQRNVRRQGWAYLPFRLGSLISALLDRLAARMVSPKAVSAVLKAAFPGWAFRLSDLTETHGIPVLEVGNLNAARAAETLRGLEPDLGIVVGTRILKRSTFAVPRMGCLNLHLGKVPEYRGMPPGFWELYDGQTTAGVTVHVIDDGLDTGDVVGEDVVPIHEGDTPETLRRKLEARGIELLARCVADFARGSVRPRRQPPYSARVRTTPTRRERHELRRRLRTREGRQGTWVHAAKTLLHLFIYYAGLFHLVRAARRLAGTSRACVILYHRVNDFSDDPLTTDVRRFVEHMLVLRRYYAVVPSSLLVEWKEADRRFPGNSVAIHFDDCYRGVYTHARPILVALGLPASCFVASGYVGTEKRFPHDASYPWIFENLRPEDLRDLAATGFEIGSHTVNHIDLGQCTDATARTELVQSKRDLEAIVGRPVTLFSYPFGGEENVQDETPELVRRSGYRAMFSAYGGYIGNTSSVFNLPRVGVNGDFRPLDLLVEIEGLSVGTLKRRWRRLPS